MTNFKLIIAYDGSRYLGWEKQPGKPTIQGKIEEILNRLTGDAPELQAAGRTDAGVHARGMCASVHLDTELSPEALKKYINRYLPEDICVTEVKPAAEGFHARYRARGKWYRYSCYIGTEKPLFDRRYVTVLDQVPDTEQMKRAAALLLGERDFKSFCGNSHMKKSSVRRIDSIAISVEEDRLYLDFKGNGFLQNMVRILTGTLLEVGFGKRSPDSIPELLEARDRRLAGPTAPAAGLCLMEVYY